MEVTELEMRTKQVQELRAFAFQREQERESLIKALEAAKKVLGSNFIQGEAAMDAYVIVRAALTAAGVKIGDDNGKAKR